MKRTAASLSYSELCKVQLRAPDNACHSIHTKGTFPVRRSCSRPLGKSVRVQQSAGSAQSDVDIVIVHSVARPHNACHFHCKSAELDIAAACRWGQCGGQGYLGPAKCPDGYKCTALVGSEQFYSQCLPDSAGADGKLAWEQCGGKGYDGVTRCAFGNKCVVVNQYYSQCQESR